ncbi:heat shock protein Hsp90 [Sanghuangporus baumii]|uniref:Heat shock protein Hsp90 n=1 Tax=Sanghuangporus baumii TaxID=108892 RepID=A0A9Q5N870_SANBA|nr:heat shock protein Hsp90 [Sanghuangporus baumii]
MRILRPFLLTLSVLSTYAFAQDVDSDSVPKEKHAYQSDVARLRKIVINSLYSHRDVFLRELISNANDALEKLRLISLTDKRVWDGSEPLNISIKAVKNEDGPGGRVIISDTGIGMSPEELAANLGTLAKSGTTEFLQRAENSNGTNNGNLIGAFGLGFYSSFLVADRVYVASLPPKTAQNPDPVQHVFSSSADESAFEVYPDPRGNTLGRGTEITLVLKEDASEFLETKKLQELVNKHSGFSTTFPIYLFHQHEDEVPVEDEESPASDKSDPGPEKQTSSADDDDEAVIEEVSDEEKDTEEKEKKTKKVLVDEWMHINPLPPVWLRDSKDVTDEEYSLLYQATFRDFTPPLAWQHFAGDTGSGISFKAILFIPSRLDDKFWSEPLNVPTKDIRLLVKRVFITNDFGSDEPLPKWTSWIKVIIDADDLPLNVSRESLQQTKFLKQIKQIIVKRLIQLLTKIADEDLEKFKKIQQTYGPVIKLGAVESPANREKLAALARFHTTQRDSVSLDEYLENRKQGQKQIFYLADVGKPIDSLKKSVFVEKLHARGYEVLLLNEPLDEILFQNLKRWKKMSFQDVAKAGLKFDLDQQEEKEQQKELSEKYKPLITWLKERAQGVVRDVVISNRLVTSPCAIVADEHGYTANVEKLLNAANRKQQNLDFMHEFAKKQKLLEINPRSPLIEGLLRRVEQLPSEDEERDLESETELEEVATILIDGALVRSGFEVPDSNEFFSRVDRVLRRSLGVSETARADDTVKPAPPVDPELPSDDDSDFEALPMESQPTFGKGKPMIEIPDELKEHLSIEVEEVLDDEPVSRHDEL